MGKTRKCAAERHVDPGALCVCLSELRGCKEEEAVLREEQLPRTNIPWFNALRSSVVPGSELPVG